MEPISWSGEAVLKQVGPDRIAVVIDTNRDRKIDMGFTIRSDRPVSSIAPIHFSSVHVEEKQGEVRFVGDNRVIEFGMITNSASRVQRFVGYELVRNNGETGVALDPRSDRYEFDPPMTRGAGYGPCNSGGAGATSCSTSRDGKSCSATCGAGYFACCSNDRGCRCVTAQTARR